MSVELVKLVFLFLRVRVALRQPVHVNVSGMLPREMRDCRDGQLPLIAVLLFLATSNLAFLEHHRDRLLTITDWQRSPAALCSLC